jgi:hypothetical protein
MRALILLLTLLAAATLAYGAGRPRTRLALSEVSVTRGAGREPRDGVVPPPHLEARLLVTRMPRQATLRFWKLEPAQLEAARKGRGLKDLGVALELLQEPQPDGSLQLRGTWPEASAAGDLLVVEAWRGRRRLAWTSAPVVEHLLQSRPRGRDGESR